MGIFDLFSVAPAQNAANAQTNAIMQGLGGLKKDYASGRGELTTDYAKALAPWTQQFGYAQRGQNTLADALGLNGPEGNARAQAAFQNNPGYQFQLGQGENAVLANAARMGQLNSGNTDIDLTKFAQGLAGTSWNNYLGNLQPFLGAGQNAAGGIAGVNTGLGNAMNQSYTGQGQATAQALGAIGNAQANAALAPYQTSANELGALFGAAKLATGAIPGIGSAMKMFG